MFFVIWSKRAGGRCDAPLMDYWKAFETLGDATRLYMALIEDNATYTATIAGNVLASTDYETTKQGEPEQ